MATIISACISEAYSLFPKMETQQVLYNQERALVLAPSAVVQVITLPSNLTSTPAITKAKSGFMPIALNGVKYLSFPFISMK